MTLIISLKLYLAPLFVNIIFKTNNIPCGIGYVDMTTLV